MTNFNLTILVSSFLLLLGCATHPKAPKADQKNDVAETVSFSRIISIKTCDKNKKCSGFVANDLKNSEVTLQLEEFNKGTDKGVTGQDAFEINESGVPFRSEIRVIKKKGEDQFYVYMMIRSGSSLKRNGKIKTFSVSNLSDLAEVNLKDDPISISNGTIQAQLTIRKK